MNNVKVRFSPAPTGFLHIAHVRTVLYNYLFAYQNNGELYLRIEDTNREKYKDEYLQNIFFILNILKIKYHPDVVYQSQRFDIYKEYAEQLYKNGFAYYCQCNVIEEHDKPVRCNCRYNNYTHGVLRFKVQDNIILEYNDIISKKNTVNTCEIEDFALLRSDGISTYHLAVTVDDYLMKITHVIRGSDHQKNTFKQLLIYNAFQWSMPQYAHLPLILGIDGKKLSKRNGSTSVNDLLDEGIMYTAIINSVLLLGWGLNKEEITILNKLKENDTSNVESMTLEQAKYIFKLSRVQQKSAVYDKNKMLKFSSIEIKKLINRSEVYDFIKKVYSTEKELFIIDKIYSEVCKRVKTKLEFIKYIKYIIKFDISYINSYINELDNYIIIDIMNNFNINNLFSWLSQLENKNIYYMHIRYILAQNKHTIDLDTLINALGYNECIRRIKLHI